MQQTPLDDDHVGPYETFQRNAHTRSMRKAQGLLGIGDKSSRNKLTKTRVGGISETDEELDLGISPKSYTPLGNVTGMSMTNGEHPPNGLRQNPVSPGRQTTGPQEDFKPLYNAHPAYRQANGDLPPTPSSVRTPVIDNLRVGDRDALASTPWSSSQQTLTSSAKDSGSTRSFPTSYANSTESILKKKPRTKESALKQSRSAMDMQQSSDDASARHRSRRLDVPAFFSRARKTTSRFSPSNFFSSPTEMTEAPDFMPPHTTHAELKRRTGTGRLEVITTDVRNPSVDSGSTSTIRAKVFEPAVFDPSRTTVKRPPKGITNWFDAIDLDSDEEALNEEQNTRSNSPDAAVDQSQQTSRESISPTMQRNAMVQSSAPDAIDTTPAELAAPNEPSSQIHDRVVWNPSFSVDAWKHPPSDTAKNASADPARVDNHAAATPVVTTVQAAKTPAMPKDFASGSNLYLTDSDSDSAEQNVATRASTKIFQRPQVPPRKVHNPASPAKKHQTIIEEEPILPPAFNRNSRSSNEKKKSNSSSGDRLPNYSDQVNNACRSSQSSSRRRHSQRRLTGSSTQTRFEETRTPTSPVGSNRRSGNLSDGDRMMAVTEDEMMLLELVRRKKISMQKDFSPEGYSNGVSEALMQLKMGRESAHLLGLEMLKRKERMLSGKRGSQSGSVASSSVSGPAALPESRRGSRNTLIGSQDLSYEQYKELNAIRKEDSDNAKRLERFLRQQSPVDDQFPTSLPETMLSRGGVAGERDSVFSSSQFEETLAQAGMNASPTQILTQRLTDTSPVRDSISTTFEEQQDFESQKFRGYLDAQKIVEARKFERLYGVDAERKQSIATTVESDADVETNDEDDTDATGNSDATADDGIRFPQPPMNRLSVTVEDRLKRGGRMNLLDSPVLEEEPVPDMRTSDLDSSEPTATSKQSYSGPSTKEGFVGRTVASQNASASDWPLSNKSPLTPQTWRSTESTPIASSSHAAVPEPTISTEDDSEAPVMSTAPPTPLTPRPMKPHNTTAMSSNTENTGDAYQHVTSPADVATRHSPNSMGQTTQPPASTDMSPSSSIDSWKNLGRVTSMSSINSAGGDVLAAWAGLGGGSDAFTARRQISKRTGRNSTYQAL